MKSVTENVVADVLG